MAGSAVLAGLLRQLSRAASPLERMKLLAMSWRALRQMSPAEREQLAHAVGMDEAHELVEQIADPKVGLSPSKLLVALQQTDENDVSRLRAFLGNVRTREGRKRLFTQGVETLTKRLDKQEGEGEQKSQDQQAPVVATPPEIKPAPVHLSQPQPAAMPEAAKDILAPQSELEPAVSRPAAPQAKAAVVAAAGAAAAAATTSRAAAPAPKAAPAPAKPPAPAPKTPAANPQPAGKAKAPAAAKPVEAAKAPKPRLEQTGKGLLVKVRACDTVSEKFRLLRTRQDLMRHLSWPQIRELCETFPEGWSRRRAVDLVLKGSVLKNLSGLKDLLELLPEGKDRDWVLAGLIRARQLTRRDLSHLGELSLSPRLARLLARQSLKKSA